MKFRNIQLFGDMGDGFLWVQFPAYLYVQAVPVSRFVFPQALTLVFQAINNPRSSAWNHTAADMLGAPRSKE